MNQPFSVITRLVFGLHPNDMQRIILALLLFCWCVQNNYAQDLALVDIKLSADQNNNVPIGINSGIEVSIRNSGQASVPVGTEISIGLSALNEYFEFTGELSSNIAFGDTITISFGEQTLLIDTFDIFSIDGFLIAENDTNSANNSLTADFFPSPFISNDWWCKHIKIVAPTNLDTIDLDNNTNNPPAIESIKVTFANIGEITYLPFTKIDYQITLGRDTSSINTNLGALKISPGDTIFRVITNQSLIPQIPDTLGTFDLCAISLQVQDFNPGNDTSCFRINVIDNFDPTDPLNWPTSADNNATSNPAPYLIQHTDNGVQLKANEAVSFQIHDLQGKLITENKLLQGESIALPLTSKGLYVILVKGNNGQLTRQKILSR